MEQWKNWWKRDKRWLVLMKSLLLALLPPVCCLVYCAGQGRGLAEVYLPVSEWNDELFYYKQVEGMVAYGYPQGYFGFNESHALKLSFAAWSPVLVFPWVIWGLLFGWNMMSPIFCNIVLMSLCCFLFVWLVRPTWKQLGILTVLFCLYTPFVRYMLSVMPEVICFSMLIIFYSLAINYLRRGTGWKLALLFLLSGVMTLMRPYMLLFLLLPAWFWIRESKWKGAAGSLAVLTAVLGLYAYIKKNFGAEYFAPLFFTDWVTAFFEQGFFGGIRYTFGKLYYMGKDFGRHTIQGIRTGLASGAFFGGFLVCMAVLTGQSLRDYLALRKQGHALREQGQREQGQVSQESSRVMGEQGQVSQEPSRVMGEQVQVSQEPSQASGEQGSVLRKQEGWAQRLREEKRAENGKEFLVIEAHLAFSFVAMFFALLLMYKLTEGSKHLLTFMAAALFVISLMETKFYKKATLIGIVFAYFYSYMAVDAYDYQVPFAAEERYECVEQWRETLSEDLMVNRENAPSYENVVIWLLYDTVEGEHVNTQWQLLYALPEGFGISCCMPEYVEEHFESLRGKYLCMPAGGAAEGRCVQAGYRKVVGNEETVLYQIY